MKVYVPKYQAGAGRAIYRGYANAWKSLGYDVQEYNRLSDINPIGDYYLMTVDSEITYLTLDKVLDAKKSFVFVQPNTFPKHWGSHPNFITNCEISIRKILAKTDSYLWTFTNTKYSKEYFNDWAGIGISIIPKYVPLAFDNFHYTPQVDLENEYDVCFVGGLANNGFNEKYKIMMDYLKPLMDKKFSCLYVNSNISDNYEIKLLTNCKVAINLHDAYQQELGLDTNERTFKSLGLNGTLVSDHVEELTRLFNIKGAKNPIDFYNQVQDLLNNPDLEKIKEQNRKMILSNHTYVNRINLFLSNEDFNNSSML